eukprot:4354875-Pyramimonas_sp.AAC.3
MVMPPAGVPGDVQAAARRTHGGVPQHLCQLGAAVVCDGGAHLEQEDHLQRAGVDPLGPLDLGGGSHRAGAARLVRARSAIDASKNNFSNNEKRVRGMMTCGGSR